MTWDLRCGKWQDVLKDVERVDSIICDPPYSARTHDRSHSRIAFDGWEPSDVEQFVDSWAPRVQSWMCCLTDSDLQRHYRSSFGLNNLTGFAPVPCVINGMTVRLYGDGPSSWAVYLMVARTKAARKWGTLPGAYSAKQGERMIVGSKSLDLMRQIVCDYSRPGDTICDPFAGSGTTLLAAVMEGRNAIGAEMDRDRYEMALKRLQAWEAQPQLPGVVMHEAPVALDLFGGK